MSPLAIAILAFSMSADAFAAALGKGAALHKPPPSEALRIGLIFGIVETITPLIGWGIGYAAADYVVAFDHWIAFGLLTIVGLRMIWEAAHRAHDEEKPTRHRFMVLVVTAIGTSIDAMAVGVGLVFLHVAIMPIAVAIGLATFLMATIGVLIGGMLGRNLGRIAELLGGLGLIALGLRVLYQHFAG